MKYFSMCAIAILQSDVLLSSTSPFHSEDSGRFQWAGDFFLYPLTTVSVGPICTYYERAPCFKMQLCCGCAGFPTSGYQHSRTRFILVSHILHTESPMNGAFGVQPVQTERLLMPS